MSFSHKVISIYYLNLKSTVVNIQRKYSRLHYQINYGNSEKLIMTVIIKSCRVCGCPMYCLCARVIHIVNTVHYSLLFSCVEVYSLCN